MIRTLIFILLALTILILGLSLFLAPDDLRSCADKPSGQGNCSSVGAIVVVSGGDTNARTDEAIKLFHNGWSNKLILSGAAQDKSGPSNAAAMKNRALAAGVPESSILLDEYAENTQQNAENAQNIFAAQNIKDIILVTSGYHQRRASLEFNARTTGVKVINHPVSSDSDWSVWWWVTPRGWWLAGGEFVKVMLFYTGIVR